MGSEAASLDDPAAIRSADPGGMLGLIAHLGEQLRAGYAAGAGASGLPSSDGIRSVAVCGMGGSGIAGDVAHALFAPRLPFPLAVVKGYELPEFCGRDTVVVAVSFSGATEETLAVYAEALARGCRLVAVSKEGRLAGLARTDEVAHVAVPLETPPIPRAAIGLLAGSVIGVLEALGIIPPASDDVEATARVLAELGRELGPDRPEGANEAKRIARWLEGKIPVVWGSEGLAAAAAIRWKNQLNENAKLPALANWVPELDHNEIEAWSAGDPTRYRAVLLRHRGEHPRNAIRMTATAEVAESTGLQVRQVQATGTDPLAWLFSLIMVGDFASAYLAILRGVDPVAIPVLTGFKERLPT